MDPFDDHWDEGQLLVRPDIGREMPLGGTVVARGPGRWSKKRGINRRLPMSVAPGDCVMVPWATGVDLWFNGVYHRELHEDDILGTIGD